jgi:hypothetical protein
VPVAAAVAAAPPPPNREALPPWLRKPRSMLEDRNSMPWNQRRQPRDPHALLDAHDRQTDKQTDKQTDRQTDRQTDLRNTMGTPALRAVFGSRACVHTYLGQTGLNTLA